MDKIFLLVPFFIITSCSNNVSKSNSEITYSIKGKIDGKDTGWVFLGKDDTTGRTPMILFDSAKIAGSNFHFHGDLAKPLITKMMIKDQSAIPSYTSYFALDSGVTNVYLYKDSMANSIITGTPLQESLNAFNQKLYELEISFDNHFALARSGKITTDSLNKLQGAFFRDKHNLILQQIQSNPSAITSAFVARMVLPDLPDLPTLEAVCNALGNANNYYSRRLMEVLAAKKQSRSGMQAPSFSITDNKNRAFNNNSFRGKYLFLVFWASWCEPCREENPGLVQLYKMYAHKGIEFVSISIDMDKKNWENAVKKDNLPWIQACDLKGSQSKMFNDFGLYDIPANFLIDKEGKIVAKDLSVAKLEEILSKELGS